MRRSQISLIFSFFVCVLGLMTLFPDVSFAEYADDMDSFGMEAVAFIKCSLQGNIGGIIIGLGVTMALWEYFIQHRQMHVLYAILVVGLTIFLGAAIPMPDGMACDSSGSSWFISISYTSGP